MAALLHAPILLHQRTSRFDHFYDLADTSTRGQQPVSLLTLPSSTQVQFTNCTETDTKIGYRMAKSFTYAVPSEKFLFKSRSNLLNIKKDIFMVDENADFLTRLTTSRT